MPTKPHNGGEWTEARKRQFICSALRKARWPVKFKSLNKAFVGKKVNPATKRMCKAYRCAGCGGHFINAAVAVDHIEPVVSVTGFVDWNTYIERLFVEGDGFQVLCKECHKAKTDEENEKRKENKKCRNQT